jgi:thiamine-monophosphate kinase
MLSRKLELEAAAANCLRQAFSRPEPRLAEGQLLVREGVKAGIDISDGLVSDLGHICRASGVGAVIEVESLPVRPEVESTFGREAWEMALSGGEDYQLLFTAGPQAMERVRRASSYPVTVIGEVVAENAGQVILIDREGKRTLPAKKGWDHFKRDRV